MQNAGLDEAQAGIKIARRNIYNLRYADAAAAKSLQSCPTLCDPVDGSPPGSTVLGIHIHFFKIQIRKNIRCG